MVVKLDDNGRLRSILQVTKSKTGLAMRTTVPQVIIGRLGLREGDMIVWCEPGHAQPADGQPVAVFARSANTRPPRGSRSDNENVPAVSLPLSAGTMNTTHRRSNAT